MGSDGVLYVSHTLGLELCRFCKENYYKCSPDTHPVEPSLLPIPAASFNRILGRQNKRNDNFLNQEGNPHCSSLQTALCVALAFSSHSASCSSLECLRLLRVPSHSLLKVRCWGMILFLPNCEYHELRNLIFLVHFIKTLRMPINYQTSEKWSARIRGCQKAPLYTTNSMMRDM